MTVSDVLNEGVAIDFEEVSSGVLDVIRPVVEREMREAANQLYGATMEAVQDYLSDNVNFNIRSRLNAAEAGRRAEWERAESLTQQRDDLFWALKGLVHAARTSGGVAGADLTMMAACEKGERAIEAAFDATLRQAARQSKAGGVMGEVKHTPGPWVWKRSDRGEHESLVVSGTLHNYVLYPETELSDYGLSSKEWCELSEANARLIAAAPDMLEVVRLALKTMLDEAEARNFDPPANPLLIAELEAAIARATQSPATEGGVSDLL